MSSLRGEQEEDRISEQGGGLVLHQDQRASSQHRCAGRLFPETQNQLEGDFPTGVEETSAQEKSDLRRDTYT